MLLKDLVGEHSTIEPLTLGASLGLLPVPSPDKRDEFGMGLATPSRKKLTRKKYNKYNLTAFFNA